MGDRAGFAHEAPLGGNYDDRPHSFEEHGIRISDTWLRYPVGYRYSYSNLGIDLSGYILQEKSGMPFWDYIEKKVLIPTGMIQSTMDPEKILRSRNGMTMQVDTEYWPGAGCAVDSRQSG